MATKYGVTPTGFVRPRLPEIRQMLMTDLAAEWGVPLSNAPNSVIGVIASIFSERIADLWECAEGNYFAMYPHTADDVTADNAVAYSGVQRLAAEKTTTPIIFYGKKDTLVPSGTRVASVIDTMEYSTIASGKISLSNVVYLEIMAVPEPSATYSITIDGSTYSVQAGLNSTAAEIIAALYERLLGYQVAVKDGKLQLNKEDQQLGWVVSLSTNLYATQVGSPVICVASDYGAHDPPAGTLTKLVTLISGVDRVQNNTAATVGRDMESTTEMRLRYEKSVYRLGSAMVESVRAHLLQDVPGVTAAIVHENVEDIADSEGRPPHSIEAIVQGGNNATIAKTIFVSRSGGIQTFGTAEEQVQDSQGGWHTIRFNRPSIKKIWLKAVIYRTQDEELGGDTTTSVRKILLEEGRKLTIGQDVVLQRFFGAIYKQTTGIGQINLIAASGDTSPAAELYSANNIAIGIRELAEFDWDRIEVTVGG